MGIIGLDQTEFEAHINNGKFLDGVSRKQWRLVKQEWPLAWIMVSAAPIEGLPDEYMLRFELSNYPQSAPAATLWNIDLDVTLDHNLWPAGTGPVSTVFRPEWNPNALYVAMDRIGLQSHPEWSTGFPHTSWNSRREITHYLGLINEYLISAHYKGNRGTIGSHCQCAVCMAQVNR
jgi:hypothetical protein